jgi:methyl-accepting chemotaxis protein
MKISTKLTLFYVAVLAVFCVLAVSLAMLLHSVSIGYDTLLNTHLPQIDRARVIQVNFKKQVQEWKDVLLRGHDPDDLLNYTTQFHAMEEKVHRGASELSLQVQDPEAKQLLDEFVEDHLALDEKYELAYQVYLAGNADFKAADKIVRGQDRAPTDLFDKVVERLAALVQDSVNAQTETARRGRNLAIGISGGSVLLIGLVGFFLVRDIVNRLALLKDVSDRLSRADISGLAIDVSGHDEIAEFGKSLTGVHAAIEELLHVSAEQNAEIPAGGR